MRSLRSLRHNPLLTLCWIYLSRNDCALRLSTGQSKNPWISFCHKSTVIMWLNPALVMSDASSLQTMLPRVTILPRKWKKINSLWGIQNRETALLTQSCMYWIRKGEALRLSTAQSKKPKLSLEWRSTVMMWSKPPLTMSWAKSLSEMLPRRLILAATFPATC